MKIANEEEYDEAFLLELDAAEAAAIANRASSTNPAPLGPQRDAAGAHPYSSTLEHGCSTRKRSTQRARDHGTVSGMHLSWKVGSIAVRDDDAAAGRSTEERIGEVRGRNNTSSQQSFLDSGQTEYPGAEDCLPLCPFHAFR